ncbi:hypothetical protein D7X33_28070 [Butyricicoccus sp. 1XD8-22]|nr:hypothetical protein D7X33_28070 [Butyricicoccus sp. 1XD8-22]
MSLQVKDETVYVIYHNGEPYNGTGRKIVYTTKGAAKGVITKEAKELAEYKYEEFCDWYELSRTERDRLIQNIINEFEIVEYTPKMKVGD